MRGTVGIAALRYQRPVPFHGLETERIVEGGLGAADPGASGGDAQQRTAMTATSQPRLAR